MIEENVNLVVEEEKEDTILLVYDERMKKKNVWYLDNGSNNHICEDKDKFIEPDESIRGNVTFADHSKVSIKRKCTILIQMKKVSIKGKCTILTQRKDSSHQFIGNVYFISTIKSKYIEFRKIIEE
jgi:hypothetical protein